MTDAELIVALKTELAHTIGKLATARGQLYDIQLDLDELGEDDTLKSLNTNRKMLKIVVDLTAGDSTVLTHDEISAGFKWMNERVAEAYSKEEETHERRKSGYSSPTQGSSHASFPRRDARPHHRLVSAG